MITTSYKQYDVVIIPFPFTDKFTDKKRPALTLSNQTYHQVFGDYILMMITSKTIESGLDVPIIEWEALGLRKVSYFRPILFTCRESKLLNVVGQLSPVDIANAKHCLYSAI